MPVEKKAIDKLINKHKRPINLTNVFPKKTISCQTIWQRLKYFCCVLRV